jgi:phosphatidylglycerophosphate synthase
MHFINQFKATLKGVEMESVLDLFFFRPFAFIFMKMFYHTPLTPNHVSYLSMLTGLASGYYFAKGTKHGFVIGGTLILLSQILDCSDGMLARFKKNGTKTGRIIDGLTDYVTSIAAFIGIGIGLSKFGFNEVGSVNISPWTYVVITGISFVLHAIYVDKYRNQYETYGFGKSLDPATQITEFQKELEYLKSTKGSKFDIIIISIYLFYTNLQGTKEKTEKLSINPNDYKSANRYTIKIWNLIGPSEHIFFMGLAFILLTPSLFFYYTVIFANIFLIIAYILQKKADDTLQIK